MSEKGHQINKFANYQNQERMSQNIIREPVSIKHGLRTAYYGLRTGYKIWTRYKTRTGKYGLGIKHGLGIKRGLQAADWV